MEEIAKSAANEAAKISAEEAAASAAEEARKTPEEPDKPSGKTSEPVITDAEMGEAGSDKPSIDIHPSAPEAQARTGPLDPINQQQESGVPSSSGVGEPAFEDAIAEILAPFSSSVTVPDSSDDGSADLASLKTMAAGFKDVQDRYGKRWEKLHTQQQAVELAEQKLKEKAEEIHRWYNEKSQSIRRQDERLAAAKEKAAALDGKLAERETQLVIKEKDLAVREEAPAAKLHGKDEEIQTLLMQRTSELEENHKKAIETQA